MTTRRNFLTGGIAGLVGAGIGFLTGKTGRAEEPVKESKALLSPFKGGLVLSTWDAGISANKAAWQALESGGNALDMAEKGVNDTEADLRNLSVGLGGLPDREGHTTLDACIMDSKGNAGSVMFLENILHPASVARRVMEKTPHVQIVGEGAYQFAISEGFEHNDFKSEEAQKAWQEWLKTSNYKPVINIENHDTIGLLSMDRNGDIAGSCTTSGLAYKMRGRVGDSPIIGAGLYVDNEVGAATSTGLGEVVIRACGSFLVVELMRQGATPQKACEEAVHRIAKMNPNFKDFQVGFLAVNKAGEIGAYAYRKGFTYALYKDGKNEVYPSAYYME
jgi:N4-(beta-N-acetylglucosaminyl)-L-asparaginase